MPSIRQKQPQGEHYGHVGSKAISSAKTRLRQEQQMSGQRKEIALPNIVTSNMHGEAKSPPEVGARRFNQSSAQMNNTGQKSL